MSLEIPSEEDIYYIALLVSNGWRRGYLGRWRHPDGEKYKYFDWDKNHDVEDDE